MLDNLQQVSHMTGGTNWPMAIAYRQPVEIRKLLVLNQRLNDGDPDESNIFINCDRTSDHSLCFSSAVIYPHTENYL